MDYRGECNVILTNLGDKHFVINKGDRIAQFVLNKVEQILWSEVSSKDDLEDSTRGEGGFGSSGVS